MPIITINVEKAKEVKKDILRELRKPLLEEQDVLFQRALETGQETTAIVAEKQRLRDITNLVNDCTTFEQIKAVTI